MKHTNKKNLAAISAVNMYTPDRILTNFDLEKMVDTSDEWIRSRTGIEKRHIVAAGQATADMSTQAVQKILQDRNLSADEIDVIIVATVTPDMMFPSTAALVQNNIGATNCWGFDLSAGCSGFLFALQTGAQFIEAGIYKKVIVVGSDTMSSIIDYSDRNTCILFGDGAGAVLLEPSEDENGIIDSKLRIDGSGAQYLHQKAGGSLNPATHSTVGKKWHNIYQEGRKVYKFAVKGMVEISKAVIERNNLTNDDIKMYLPHQANKRIIEAAGNRLGLKNEQVFMNIDQYANTTAATIPIGLYEAYKNGQLEKDDNVILATFGAGFTWGAMYLKWGLPVNG